jgi:hypothetical protein
MARACICVLLVAALCLGPSDAAQKQQVAFSPPPPPIPAPNSTFVAPGVSEGAQAAFSECIWRRSQWC